MVEFHSVSNYHKCVCTWKKKDDINLWSHSLCKQCTGLNHPTGCWTSNNLSHFVKTCAKPQLIFLARVITLQHWLNAARGSCLALFQRCSHVLNFYFFYVGILPQVTCLSLKLKFQVGF